MEQVLGMSQGIRRVFGASLPLSADPSFDIFISYNMINEKRKRSTRAVLERLTRNAAPMADARHGLFKMACRP